MINVALIGFGGISKAAHYPAYKKLQEAGLVNLTAICDVTPAAFSTGAAINIGSSNERLSDSIHTYSDRADMFRNEEIDLVDVCVPTPYHAEIAIDALQRGYHVLCEKPMSYSYENCVRMVDAAKAAGRKLMIGQCLRFGSKYRYLKKVVDENTFGKVMGGVFHRLSGPPVWGWNNWYLDYNQSHGCINDMHIHDIDMIRWLFGDPKSVSCDTQDFYSGKDAVFSVLKYDGFDIHALGDWSLEGMPFSADYRIAFEKATVDYSNDRITVYPRGKEAFAPDVADDDFYFNEIEYFVKCIENGSENTDNPPESAAMSVKLIEALIESSDRGGERVPFCR